MPPDDSVEYLRNIDTRLEEQNMLFKEQNNLLNLFVGAYIEVHMDNPIRKANWMSVLNDINKGRPKIPKEERGDAFD